MRTFLLFCVVIAAVASEDLHLTSEQREKIRQHSIECVSETGANAEVVADAKNGNFTDNEDLKSFLFCFFKKTKIFNADGVLNIDVALQRMPPGADKALTEKVLKECNTKTGPNARDTAYEIVKCYQVGTNYRLVFE